MMKCYVYNHNNSTEDAADVAELQDEPVEPAPRPGMDETNQASQKPPEQHSGGNRRSRCLQQTGERSNLRKRHTAMLMPAGAPVVRQMCRM
jgi:hypothetical protein